MLRQSPSPVPALALASATAAVLLAAPTPVGAVGTASAEAAPAPAGNAGAGAAATTLYYDDSGAAEFQDEFAAGAEQWNAAVDGVELVRADTGRDAEITVTATDGWPMATLGPVRPGGSGWIEFGRSAVEQGHDPVRIAAHELGHSLGLPDSKPGPCSSLMSGASAGTDCADAAPDAGERAEVEALYGSGSGGAVPADGRVLVDAP